MSIVQEWVDSEYKYHKPLFDRLDASKQKNILAWATKEFANRGFDLANINTIADKAGVSVGSLYKYFGSKKNLFQYILRKALFKLQEVLSSVEHLNNMPLILRIEILLNTILETSKKNSDMIKLYLNICATEERQNAKILALEIEKPSASVYLKIIKEAQKKGEVSPDLEPRVAVFLLDNIFMSFQFSCVSDYYQERCKIYTGSNLYDKDKLIINNTLAFIKNALGIKDIKPQKKRYNR